MRVEPGIWTGASGEYHYQWKEYVETTGSYEPIEGATSSTYALGPLDSNHKIEVEVGATNAAGTTWAISAPTANVTQLSTANLWVSPGGGSCERSGSRVPYESSRACATFNDAYQRAACGDVIQVKSGEYGEGGTEGKKGKGSNSSETILANSSLENCSKPVMFQPGPGETPTINKLQLGKELGNATAPGWVALNNLTIYQTVNANGPAHNITVDHQHGATVGTNGGHYIKAENSEFGPCDDSLGPSVEWPCESHASIESGSLEPKYTAEYVTFAHNIFRDFQTTGHFECMFISGGHHILIEGNRWANCSEEGLFAQEAIGSLGWISDLTIQNNWFARTENPEHVVRGTAAELDNTWGEHILLRYNSFGAREDYGGTGQNHSPHNIVAIGNIWAAPSICDESFEYHYNVGIRGAHEHTCGNETLASVPYVDATEALLGEPLVEDFHLATGAGSVPNEEANDRIEWDYSGDRRAPDGPWEAGSEE